jgi:hypothetical protein
MNRFNIATFTPNINLIGQNTLVIDFDEEQSKIYSIIPAGYNNNIIFDSLQNTFWFRRGIEYNTLLPNRPLSISSQDKTIVDVTSGSSGKVTIKKHGSTPININQDAYIDGLYSYSALNVDVFVLVRPLIKTKTIIEAPNLTFDFDEYQWDQTPILINYTTNNKESSLIVDIVSTHGINPSVSITNNQVIFTPQIAGTYTLKFSQPETTNYYFSSLTRTITVNPKTTIINSVNSITRESTDIPFYLDVTSNRTNPVYIYASSNPDVATIDIDGRVQLNNSGIATLTVSLPENNISTAASKEIQLYVYKTSNIQNGQQIKITTPINIDKAVIRYIPQSFVNLSRTQYLRFTGFKGVLTRFTITSDITDFSNEPLNIEIDLPNVHPEDYGKTFKLYKIVDNDFYIDDKYPRDVIYDENIQKWKTTLPTLSEFIVVDTTAPENLIGGDPFILNVNTMNRRMLNNNIKTINIYESDNYSVEALLERLHKDKITNMHTLNYNRKNERKLVRLDKLINCSKYITEVKIVNKQNNKTLIIDCYQGMIKHDDGCIQYEKIVPKKGIYNIVLDYYYPKKNIKGFVVYLDNSNHLSIKVDNWWVELNNIKLYKM